MLYYLSCVPGGVYCDGTIGLGGHAEKILEFTSPGGRLIGIDLDSLALEKAKERLARFGERVILVKGNFKDLPSILQSFHFPTLNGVLLDLGLSSLQLQCRKRGFSFLYDAPLIMNFDINGEIKALDIINQYSESGLTDLFRKYGEERWSRRIARKIVKERAKTAIVSTKQLVGIIYSAIPGSLKRRRIHPATRIFQALRIKVNNELDNLDWFLEGVWGCLKPGGRVCIVSYHSLEDGLVKKRFREKGSGRYKEAGKEGAIDIITKKPIRPGIEEVKENPRSRSARMRVAEWH